MRSQTIRKYPGYFIPWMIRISSLDARFVRRQIGFFSAPRSAMRLEICEPILESVANNFRKIGIDGVSRRNGEFRKRIVDLLQFQAAPLGNLDSLIENVRDLAEDAIHILAGLEIKLIGVELHPVRIVHRLAGLNAQQDVVRAAIILLHVVAVVGRGDLNAGALADPQHVGNDLSLLLQTVVVDFEKEPILAEDILVLGCRFLRLLESARQHIG